MAWHRHKIWAKISIFHGFSLSNCFKIDQILETQKYGKERLLDDFEHMTRIAKDLDISANDQP